MNPFQDEEWLIPRGTGRMAPEDLEQSFIANDGLIVILVDDTLDAGNERHQDCMKAFRKSSGTESTRA